GLDTLCNRNFTFTGQQFHRPHFAQVHADRVIRAAKVGGRKITAAILVIIAVIVTGFFIVALFIHIGLIFDKRDTDIGQHRHSLVDLVGRIFTGRQRLVQFIVGDVTALFALGDDLLDRFRQRTTLHGGFIAVIYGCVVILFFV